MKFQHRESSVIYEIEPDPCDTVRDIKEKLSAQINVPIDHIRLLYEDRMFDDSESTIRNRIGPNEIVLFDYDRESDQSGRNLIAVTVISYITDTNEDMFTVKVDPSETVLELKRDILCRLGLEEDSKWVELHFYGPFKLEDDKTMIDCGVKEGDSIRLTERKVHLTSLNIKCEPIECRVEDASIFSGTIDAILKRLNIDQQFKSSIKLFDCSTKSYKMKSDFDIYKKASWNRDSGYQIYYFIKPIVDNLIRIKELGEGSFGKVYLCTDIDSNFQKALKKFNFNLNNSKDHSDFNREIETFERLGDHPRIIKYERHFEEETALFIQMEYMSGGSLASYLKTNGPLSEDKISKYAKQICEGLKHLHDNKILHRDVKGENILLDSKEDIKLSDFGLSKILMGLPSRYFLNAAANTQVGTINYMAPEVINEDQFGSAADIWSFGATVVEMVTGHPPFHKKNAPKIITVIMNEKSIPFSYPLNSSDRIKSFINRCLQGDPLKRSTVDELLSDVFLNLDI